MNSLVFNGLSEQGRHAALDTLNTTNTLTNARTGYLESNRSTLLIQRAERALRQSSLAALGTPPSVPNKQRTIYSAGNSQRLPGNKVRKEGDPPLGDLAVDQAYQFMGNTFDFYWQVFQRNSVDDQGAQLHGSVHFSGNYDNAFWDGQQMIYGDGDDVQFLQMTSSVDVIGHELTHGVTQYESNLIYWGETGALNESLSDVFGSMVKQYVNGQTADTADWLIGYGLYTNPIDALQPNQKIAIRSLKAPGTAYNNKVLGKDPQPATMNKYVHTLSDNGGVHINSGIPNYAFYLAASKLGGHSWDKAGQIWYAAMTDSSLKKTAKFADFARQTVLQAQQLYSSGGVEQSAVQDSWAQVGIKV